MGPSVRLSKNIGYVFFKQKITNMKHAKRSGVGAYDVNVCSKP